MRGRSALATALAILVALPAAAGIGTAAPSIPEGFEAGATEVAPALAWSTFLGGSGDDRGVHAAVDKDGNVFVTGRSDASWGAPIRAWSGGLDVFVAKLDPDGGIIWSTFLGGAATDRSAGIVADADGAVYVTGGSDGAWGSPIRAFSGSDGFVAKLDAAGNLLWNSFLGGSTSDEAYGIALAAGGGVRVAGSSYNSWGSPVRAFDATPGYTNAFVAGLDAAGNLLWNTFLGSAGLHHIGYAVAVDAGGNVYSVGVSQNSWGWPIRAWASNPSAFVAKLAPDGDLLWNTFLGGTADQGKGVAVDAAGGVYVTGRSSAAWGSPVRAWAGENDAFVAKLDVDGALVWNTFLGGSARDFGAGIVVDDGGNACVVGESYGAWGDPFDAFSGNVVEAFVARLNADGSLLANGFLGGVYTDYGSGIAADEGGSVYLTGMSANSWGNPTRPWGGSYDAFLAKVAGMLNGRPVAANQALSTAEDTLLAVTLTATDPNLDPLTYTVVDPPAHGTLDGIAPLLTYRPAAHFAGTDVFTFKARDGVADSDSGTVTITVTPVGDPPADITLSPDSVRENGPAGTVVGSLDTTDVDPGDTSSYALVGGSGSVDNASFTISGSALRTAVVFDRETKSGYSIRVRATDQDGLSLEKAFTVSVEDANDAPTDLVLAGDSVAENEPAGTAVGTFSAADQDGGTPAFSLADGAGSADNGLFTISDGALQTAAALDHETKSALTIRVRAQDSGGLGVEQVFTVFVADRNEAPTGLSLTGATVAEGLPVGALVGTLDAVDPDAGESFTFAMAAGDGDDDNGAFVVAGAEVRTAAVFDLAARSGYSIRLKVTDRGNLQFERSFTVAVTENRPPTDITLAPASIAENEPAGTVVGTLVTDDPDGELGLAFALVDGAGSDDNGSFAIDGATLLSAQPFDHEAKHTYSVLVRATDTGGLSCDKVIAVAVADTNDAPVIEPIADQSVTAGMPLSFVVPSSDQDGDVLFCAMTSGPPGALFEEGTCTFRWTPSQARLGDWQAVFSVVDAGTPPAQAEATVALAVTPPLFHDDFTHGTSRGDPDWTSRAGKWSVDAKKRFVSTATLKNLAISRRAATAVFAMGRISANIILGQAANPNAAIVFGYRRSGTRHAWRSVTLSRTRITIGTQGGALSAKAVSLAVNRRYAVTLDLLADGRVNVTIDGVRRHTFKFTSPAEGQIGLAADRARSYFDEVTVWAPSMLSPVGR